MFLLFILMEKSIHRLFNASHFMKLLPLGIINVNIASALAYSQLLPVYRFTQASHSEAIIIKQFPCQSF